MTNYNRILKLIALLSQLEKFGLVLATETGNTEQCAQETEALGELGDTAAAFDDFNIGSNNDCKISMANGVNVACDLITTDNLNDCIENGGAHHLIKFKYQCDPITLEVENLPMCVGASCNIDDLLAGAIEEISTGIGEGISANSILPMTITDKCGVKSYTPTQSTPAKTPKTEETNGSIRFVNTFTCFVMMAATLILVRV